MLELQNCKEETSLLTKQLGLVDRMIYELEATPFTAKYIKDNIELLQELVTEKDVIEVLRVAFYANEEAKLVNPGHYETFCNKSNFDLDEDLRYRYNTLQDERDNLYTLKSLSIKLAIKLLEINTQGFSYGWGLDDQGQQVIYFERNLCQISFHGNYSHLVPEFKGSWTGVKNSVFPQF